MVMRVMVNGREVTNPAARTLAATILMLIVAFVMAMLVFVALPLIGIAVGAALGLIGVGAGSVLIGVPIAVRRGLIVRRQGVDAQHELGQRELGQRELGQPERRQLGDGRSDFDA